MSTQSKTKSTEDLLKEAARDMPRSDEAERGIISCLLQDPTRIAEVRMKVPPEAFYGIGPRLIYEACLAMDEKGLPVEVPSLASWLRERGELDRVGGSSQLSEDYTFVPTAAHYPHYTKILLAKYHLREGIGALARGLNAMHMHGAENPDEPVVDVISHAEQEVFMVLNAAQSSGGQSQVIGSAEMSHQWYDEMEKIEKNKGRVRGVATGWFDVDRAFGGLNPDGSGDLFIVAGYPGNGKTAAAVSLVEAIAISPPGGTEKYPAIKTPTLVFPLEMGRMAFCHRLYLGRAGVPISVSRNGMMRAEYSGPVVRAYDEIKQSPLFWDESNNIDIDTLCARTKVYARKHGVKCVVIDHFGHVTASTKEGRKDKLTGQIEVMHKLHALRRELGILIILLVQLNKDGRDTPANMVPNLGSLRGASEIGELATHAMFLHRPCLSKPFRVLGGTKEKTAERQEEWAEKTSRYRQLFADHWAPERFPAGWDQDEDADEELFVAKPWHHKDYEEHTLANIAKNRHGATPDNICLRFELERQRFTNRTTKLYTNNPDFRQVEIVGF